MGARYGLSACCRPSMPFRIHPRMPTIPGSTDGGGLLANYALLGTSCLQRQCWRPLLVAISFDRRNTLKDCSGSRSAADAGSPECVPFKHANPDEFIGRPGTECV